MNESAIISAGGSSQIILLVEEPTLMVARRAVAASFAESLRSAVSAMTTACELVRHYDTLALKVDTDNSSRTRSLFDSLQIPKCDAISEFLVETPDTDPSQVLSDTQLDLIRSCLSPLSNGAEGRQHIALRWPRELFISGDQPGVPIGETFEIAGAARVLSYGPYFPLPTGKWRASTVIGFSRRVGRMPFLMEVVCQDIVHRAYFEARTAGIFSILFEFELSSDRMGVPVEFRLVSQDSALEGTVALVEIGIERASIIA